MITVIDLYRNIKSTLEKTFPNIPVQIKDIKNPRMPCFYIKVIGETSTLTAVEFENDTISFDVIYFAKDDELLEILSIQKQLKTLFTKPLQVTKFNEVDIIFVEINNISFNVNEDDYVLNCTIDIELIQEIETDLHDRYELPDGYKGIPQDSKEIMEELEINTNIGE